MKVEAVMFSQALAARWLQFHGDSQPDVHGQAGAQRAGRFPAPFSTAWPWLMQALDWAAPALVTGTFQRASHLDDEGFDALDRQLQHHPLREVRLAWLLARTPLIEARYPDTAPPDSVHPLTRLAPVIRSRETHANSTFDVIVVGSGAGGAPVAWSLAKAGQRVAIVEAGGLMGATTTGAALERYYLDQGILASIADGGLALVLAGRALGGTTVMNSGTSLRPRPERLEAWDQLSGTRFASGGLDSYLDRVSAHLRIGPIPEALLDASSKLVRLGLERLGRAGSFPLSRNAPDCQGAARCCFGCPNGAKQSTDRSFLPEAVEHGATLLANTEAIGFRTDRAGVEVLVRGASGVRRLTAKRLVLAAGALTTPLILRKARLGSHWKAAGDSLKIHPASKVFGWMPGPLEHHGVPQGLGYRPPDLPRITFEGAHTPPAVTATMLQAAGARHRDWMAHYDHLANYGLMVRDRSTGWVRQVAGRRYIHYRLHEEDARDMGSGLLIAAEALFAAGAERVVMPMVGRAAEIESLAELRTWQPDHITRRNMLTSGSHPMGTAGIGRVVTADLQVIGEDHVYVADASVLPDSPGVNPQVTIMALALRLADHLAN